MRVCAAHAGQIDPTAAAILAALPDWIEAPNLAHAALINPYAGVRYLQHQLDVQVETMRRKGIAEELVQRELRCMPNALQVEFAASYWKTVEGA